MTHTPQMYQAAAMAPVWRLLSGTYVGLRDGCFPAAQGRGAHQVGCVLMLVGYRSSMVQGAYQVCVVVVQTPDEEGGHSGY